VVPTRQNSRLKLDQRQFAKVTFTNRLVAFARRREPQQTA